MGYCLHTGGRIPWAWEEQGHEEEDEEGDDDQDAVKADGEVQSH